MQPVRDGAGPAWKATSRTAQPERSRVAFRDLVASHFHGPHFIDDSANVNTCIDMTLLIALLIIDTQLAFEGSPEPWDRDHLPGRVASI